MNYTTESLNITHKSECLVVPVYEGKNQGDVFTQLDKASHQALTKFLKSGDIKSKLSSMSLLMNVAGLQHSRILFVGMGPNKPLSASHYRKLACDVSRALLTIPAKTVTNTLCFTEASVESVAWQLRQWIFALEDAQYSYTETKSVSASNDSKIKEIIFAAENKSEVKQNQKIIEESVATAEGMRLAKDLGNCPANICTPSYLARTAQTLAKQFKKIKTTVLSVADMHKLGMHSLLSVARGSDEPAKLIIMEYRAGKKSEKPVVLVGKGITFDSGGISLKPGLAMDEMKFDMCGGASVFGTMHAIAKLGLPINLVGVIAATENLPSGKATKPGDVVKSLSGQTIEILNTDAEGRLVLCDALTYIKRFDPDVVIDIATLTGAMVIALGGHPSGLLSNDDQLSEDLNKAGNDSFDRVWRLPLWDDYQEQLDSNFADMANIGSGKGAGSIVAACFLARFTKEYRWAHLDIAGTAWNSGGKAKGATGRPVPLLMQYLLNRIVDAS